jgi:hypothetical protein
LTESETSTLGYPISLDQTAAALETIISQAPDLSSKVKLVDRHLDKFPEDGGNGSTVRFLFAVGRAREIASNSDANWKLFEEVCRRDVEWAMEAVKQFTSESERQLRTAEVMDVRGRIALREAKLANSSQVKSEKRIEAIARFEDALSLFGDRIAESAESRFLLAELYKQRLLGLNGAQKKDLAKRVMEVLEPIEQKHVRPAVWEAIRQFRAESDAIQ